MKRKILSLILVFTMIMSLTTPVFAEEINKGNIRDDEKYSSQDTYPEVDIDCYPDAVAKGEEFTLEIQVEDVTDLYAVGISLKYDTNILEIVEYNNKPFNDTFSDFYNSGYSEYLNGYDSEDASIIHYATGLTGDAPGYELDKSEIAEVTFRVKAEAPVNDYFEFNLIESLEDLSTGDICVLLSDSQVSSIGYDNEVDRLHIYDNNDVNGDITLDWIHNEGLDLDAHLFVSGQNDYFDIGYENNGGLQEYPYAIFLGDEGGDEAQEHILYSQLVPGSEYIVESWDGNFDQLKSDGANITVDVSGDTINVFDINNANGSGNIWHVFFVDADYEIIELNRIDNVCPADRTHFNFSIEWNEDEPYIEGIVHNAVEGYDTVNLYIGLDTNPIVATLDNDGGFVFNNFSNKLDNGINEIEIQYPLSEGIMFDSSEIWYHMDHIYTPPQYDEVNQKFSGDIELKIYDDYEYIDADFNQMEQIYANIVEMDSEQLITQNPLTLTLNEGKYKYSVITDGIEFREGKYYYVELYSDPETKDNIGVVYFDVYPDIVVTSDNWWGNVNTTTTSIEGYLAFADDYLLDYDSFKVFVNEDPNAGIGTDITNTDSNGNFSVDIDLDPGNNDILLEFAYDDGSCSGTGGEIYFGELTPEIRCWTHDDPLYVKGYIKNEDQDNTEVKLYIGDALEPDYITNIDSDGDFRFTDISKDKLHDGVNFITLEYEEVSTDSYIIYNSNYISEKPQYNNEEKKYSGDLEIKIYDDDDINADFDNMTEIYANIFAIDVKDRSLILVTQTPLTMNLNDGKYRYSGVTDEIDFEIKEDYIVEFYSDNGAQNKIGIGDFIIYPGIGIISGKEDVNTSITTITGFLSFADDESGNLIDYYNLKIFVNEDYETGVGKEIKDVDEKGNFSVDVELKPNSYNDIDVELYYDGGTSGTSWTIYCGEEPLHISDRTTGTGYKFIVHSEDVNSTSDILYGVLYKDGQSVNNLTFYLEEHDNGDVYVALLDNDLGIGWYTVDLYNDSLLTDYVRTGEFFMSPMVHIVSPVSDQKFNTNNINVIGYISNYDSSSYNELWLNLNNDSGINVSSFIGVDGDFSIPVEITQEINYIELDFVFNYPTTHGGNDAYVSHVIYSTQEPSSNATITSEKYDIYNTSINNVPYGTTLETFESNLETANGASFEAYESDGVTIATNIATGYKVIVTAEDGVTTKTYTVSVDYCNYIDYKPTAEGYKFYIDTEYIENSSSKLYGKLYKYNKDIDEYIEYSQLEVPDIEFNLEVEDYEYIGLLNKIIDLGEYRIDLFDEEDLTDNPVDHVFCYIEPQVHLTSPVLHELTNIQPIDFVGYISNYDPNDTSDTLELTINQETTDCSDVINSDGSFTISDVQLDIGYNEYHFNYEYNNNKDSVSTWGEIDYYPEGFGDDWVFVDKSTNPENILPNQNVNLIIYEDDLQIEEPTDVIYGRFYTKLEDANGNIILRQFPEEMHQPVLDFHKEDNWGDITFEQSIGGGFPIGEYYIVLYDGNDPSTSIYLGTCTFEVFDPSVDPPVINVFSPEDGSIVYSDIVMLEGHVDGDSDNIIIETSLSDEYEVTLDLYGDFSTPITLRDGYNYIEIYCKNAGGKDSIELEVFLDTSSQPSTNATLSDLTVDGQTIEGFSPETLNYEVKLPAESTEVPTIAVITSDENATYEITEAIELPGTTTVVVTAEDEETTKTYSVEFDIEASDIKTDTILSFDVYKAEKKHQTVGSVTYTFYEKGLEVNNENTLRPGDYVYVDIYAENIINSLGVDLSITFDDNVLTVVNDEFTKKPFRIGLTEAGYITGFSKQEGINEVREGNSIKYVSGTDEEITEDNKPIGYIIFQVNLGVEGDTILNFDTAKIGWQEGEKIVDYNVANQELSLKVVDSIDVKFEYLGDSPLVGAKISVYNESDDITSDNPINIYDVINGMASFSNLDPNTQYQFVLDAPQYLTKSLTCSLNSKNELDFEKIYAGDLNDDDVIGLSDFLTLIQNYDTSNALGDLNRDSEVGLSDFLTLIQNYDMTGSTYK